MKHKTHRHWGKGSIELFKRANGDEVWNFRYKLAGKRVRTILGSIQELPTKEDARRLADAMLISIRAHGVEDELAKRFALHKRRASELRCTPDDINKRLIKQQGRCVICGSEGNLHLDHCHDTGILRDLLCHHCNVGLGHFRDNPALLRAAALYLEKYGK